MALLLEVKGLRKYFPSTRGFIFTKTTAWVKAVDGIDFSIADGETFSLVGESGCGKTTTAKMVLLLERSTAGRVLFRGLDIANLKGSEFKKYRTSVQAVFQDPYSSLNPRMRVGSIIGEPLLVNRDLTKKALKVEVEQLMAQVGLPSRWAELYPHEVSGGQRQRIATARALALSPSLIVLDEPVSGLDVSIRAQILNLLKNLQEKLGMAYLLIAHNLATVRYMSHHMGVMYLGKIVELAESEELYSHALHPYTQALLSAALPSHPDDVREEIVISGEVPSALNLPSGCRFHPRCPFVMPVCSETEPSLKVIGTSHLVACHLH